MIQRLFFSAIFLHLHYLLQLLFIFCYNKPSFQNKNQTTMQTPNRQLYVQISEAFAKGNLAFAEAYLADDIRWNILGEAAITGKEAVLEVSQMQQLESYPLITIKNIVADGNCVVIESTGEAKTKQGTPYHQTYCEVFTFREGKLAEIMTYLDTALGRETL
jgi:uncharacterized protein